MNIIILSPVSNTYFGVLKWINPDKVNQYTIVINKRHEEDYKKHKLKNVDYIVVENWHDDLIRFYIKNINKEKRIDKIFSYTEDEVLLASELRKELGIEGQGLSSAMHYRNKYLMTKAVSDAGLKTPDFCLLHNYSELEKFVDKYGYPIVIKPIDGAGAVNVCVIKNDEEIKEYIREHDLENMLCETFIPYTVYNIDGMVLGGEFKYNFVWKYVNSCLNFKEEIGGSTSSTSVLKDTKTYKDLVEYAKKVVFSLPSPSNFLYHLEVFYNGQEVVFCEIASRMGGGRIVQCIEEEFEFNPIEELLKYETGRAINKNLMNPLYFSKSYSFMLCGPMRGKITKIPVEIPFKEVFDYHIFATLGKVYGRAESIIENVAAISIKGDDSKYIEDMIVKLDKWYKNECCYEEINEEDE